MNNWGLFPAAVHRLIKSREWDNQKNLQHRLMGERSFPISISLKPPTGQQLVEDINHFQQFILAWQKFSQPELVRWEARNYRSIKNQQIPRYLMIPTMQALLAYLGKDAVKKSQQWEARMAPLLEVNKAFFKPLIKHRKILEGLTATDIDALIHLLPQLQKNAGQGLYLRALPVNGVDTKFIETLMPLISELLDVVGHGEITAAGGLTPWLGCKPNPSGWLNIRPLCPAVQARLGGFSILQLPVAELREKALPAKNILVIENLQSGLGAPPLENTLAIFGGGRNVSWMDASWLKEKNLGYWGDIDTWGLTILSDARALAANLIPLMMDRETVYQFKDKMVPEPEKSAIPQYLTQAEKILFKELENNTYGAGRLEQERISADYINHYLRGWHSLRDE